MFKTFKTQYQNKLQNMKFCLFHVSYPILPKAVQLSIKKHAVQEIQQSIILKAHQSFHSRNGM